MIKMFHGSVGLVILFLFWNISVFHVNGGLSLRAGGRVFAPAPMNVAPGYLHWGIEEK